MSRSVIVIALAVVAALNTPTHTQEPKPPREIAVCGARDTAGCQTCYVWRGDSFLGTEIAPSGCTPVAPFARPMQDVYTLSLTAAGNSYNSQGNLGTAAGLSMAGLVMSHVFGDGGYMNLNRQAVEQLDQLTSDIAARTVALNAAVQNDLSSLRDLDTQVAAKATAALAESSRARDAFQENVQNSTAMAANEPVVEADPTTRAAVVAGRTQELSSEMAGRVSEQGWRAEGVSILNLLQPGRDAAFTQPSMLAREVQRESRKYDSHVWQQSAAREFAADALRLAEDFRQAQTVRGRKLVDALVESARSARYWDTGASPEVVVPIMQPDGSPGLVSAPSPGEAPANGLVTRASAIKTERTITRQVIDAESTRVNALPPTTPTVPRSKFCIEAALRLLGAGDMHYTNGNLALAEQRYRMAVSLVDASLSVTPFVGPLKAAIEATTGYSLTTGEPLSDDARLQSIIEAAASAVGGVGVLRDTLDIMKTGAGRLGSGLIRATETFFRHVKDVNPYLTKNRIQSTMALVRTYDGLVGPGAINAATFDALETRILQMGPIGPAPGFYPVPVVGAKQLPHLPGTAQPNKSIWLDGSGQQAVLEKMGTGTFIEPHLELVEFDRVIGNVIGPNGEDLGQTTKAIIHYSRGDAHIVPEGLPQF